MELISNKKLIKFIQSQSHFNSNKRQVSQLWPIWGASNTA